MQLHLTKGGRDSLMPYREMAGDEAGNEVLQEFFSVVLH
jgi:hypothetical protein